MADAKPPAVKRAVFYDIYPGDRLKLDAKSNIAKSGGGARDFRFSPQEEFIPVFGEILKGRLIRVTYGKKVGRRQVTVFTGIGRSLVEMYWHNQRRPVRAYWRHAVQDFSLYGDFDPSDLLPSKDKVLE